ncbi:MAG TPA: addiction module protein [Saprospiraceae bacterium]|nr:addiction module protein [Saprospiraceae bacterium]
MNDSVKNISDLFNLSPSEKLQLVEDLWDDLAANPDDIPLPKWQKNELNKRKEKLRLDLSSGVPWPDVKKRIRARYGR